MSIECIFLQTHSSTCASLTMQILLEKKQGTLAKQSLWRRGRAKAGIPHPTSERLPKQTYSKEANGLSEVMDNVCASPRTPEIAHSSVDHNRNDITSLLNGTKFELNLKINYAVTFP